MSACTYMDSTIELRLFMEEKLVYVWVLFWGELVIL